MAGDGPVSLFHVGGSRGSLKLDLSTSSLAVSVGGKVPTASRRAALAGLMLRCGPCHAGGPSCLLLAMQAEYCSVRSCCYVEARSSEGPL